MRTRALIAIGGTAALLATATLTGTVSAASGTTFSQPAPARIKPGDWHRINPSGTVGTGADGVFVYALSARPLTDPTWRSGGTPAGLTTHLTDTCQAMPGVAGVILCPAKGMSYIPAPYVVSEPGNRNGTRVHYGVVYAPSPAPADVEHAVREAQVAATRPADGLHGWGSVTVRTPDDVARNKLTVAAPPLRAGASVTQSVTVDAVDTAQLSVRIKPTPTAAQRDWNLDEETAFRVTSITSGPSATCREYGAGIECDVRKPGEVKIAFTVAADPRALAWKLDTTAEYGVYSYAQEDNPRACASFRVVSPRPVRDRHVLFARAQDGRLWRHTGDGKPENLFDPWDSYQVGPGWHTYDQLTKLAPFTGRASGGGIVGRDRTGILWHYAPHPSFALATRTKVGPGWQVFDELAGVSDVTGDRKPDLVARDRAGVLWLYRGTGDPAAPFTARTRIGGGWQVYGDLVGTGDLTRDGKADLIARDRSGGLWLYQGTGNAAAPFGPRARVATGFGADVRSLAVPGDLTDDGIPDLVVQTTDGRVRLHAGTGRAADPFDHAQLGLSPYGEERIATYDTLL
ncbi:FG-GAP repeat domain-containing protein [Streptomyces sp. NPDC012888]|uniref:FG-GAP repeat domain-containing protein n=1 Tax=Streptomyces sp. NPDC012888 TaxID=3364855 RepID=UPI0036AF7D46